MFLTLVLLRESRRRPARDIDRGCHQATNDMQVVAKAALARTGGTAALSSTIESPYQLVSGKAGSWQLKASGVEYAPFGKHTALPTAYIRR